MGRGQELISALHFVGPHLGSREVKTFLSRAQEGLNGGGVLEGQGQRSRAWWGQDLGVLRSSKQLRPWRVQGQVVTGLDGRWFSSKAEGLTCRDLVSWPGIEPLPPAVDVQSLATGQSGSPG